MSYYYCFKCCDLMTFEISKAFAALLRSKLVAQCPTCNQEVKPVSCLVCFDSGEVSALGEEIDCHRGCKRPLAFNMKRTPLMSAETYAKFMELAETFGRLKVDELEALLEPEFLAGLPSRIPLDTESGTAYSLEESDKGDE